MTIAGLIVAALLQAQAAPAARIIGVEGGIELGDTAVSARVGDLVAVGDRLHTMKGASITLSAESGVIFQFRSGARFEMKSVNGGLIALTEGSVNVKNSGKPVRVETKFGQIIGAEESQEFDVSYAGDLVQVLVVRGSIKAELSDPLKVVFRNASDFGARVYEAGSISPTVPRTGSGTTVIVYPEVDNSTRPNGKRPTPITRPVPPK
jgi:hypothetical protein